MLNYQRVVGCNRNMMSVFKRMDLCTPSFWQFERVDDFLSQSGSDLFSGHNLSTSCWHMGPVFLGGFTMFFLEMVIFGNHFWRLFGQNHAIDELYYLPTFGLFVGKMMVICWFSVGFFHQQLTKTHLVRRTSWIKNSCNAQIRKKNRIVSNCGPATIIYVFFLVIFHVFNTISFDTVG